MSQKLLSFTIFDVEVEIQMSAFFTFIYLFLFIKDINMRIILFFYLMFMILLHELGHTLVAKKFNKKVYGIVIYFNGGLCIHEKSKIKTEEIFIAWGGVLAQLVLLIITIISQLTLKNYFPEHYTDFVKQAFEYGNYYNIFGMISNLLPYRDLDGVKAWKILRYIKFNNKIVNGMFTIKNIFTKKDSAVIDSGDERENFDRLRKRDVLKAIFFSLTASILSAFIWYIFVIKTGYQVGLVSIAIGFIIAKAVLYGSSGKGGKIFQVIGSIALIIAMILSSFLLMRHYLTEAGYDVLYFIPVKGYFLLTFEYFKEDPVSIIFWIFGFIEIIKKCGKKNIGEEIQEIEE